MEFPWWQRRSYHSCLMVFWIHIAVWTEKLTFHTRHYDDVIMGAIASQITSLTIVYSSVYSGAYQSKHQSSASLAIVWGIHRGPVNSSHKWPVTRKMFPFDDVIMIFSIGIPEKIISQFFSKFRLGSTGDGLLPKTMLILICEAYWRHPTTTG